MFERDRTKKTYTLTTVMQFDEDAPTDEFTEMLYSLGMSDEQMHELLQLEFTSWYTSDHGANTLHVATVIDIDREH